MLKPLSLTLLLLFNSCWGYTTFKNLPTTKDDYSKYKDDLASQQAKLSQLKADFANAKVGIEQADIDEMQTYLNELKNDEAYYVANIALATTTLATKLTAVAAQGSKASSTTATFGFNAGAELDIDAIEHQLAEYKEKSIASNLHANNINIQANNTATIQGSNLTADNEINVAAKDTNIQASRDIATSQTSTKHRNITLGYEVYGGVTTSTSADTAQSTSTQLQHTNSLLQADNININTQETTTIQGANLHANQQLNINTNNLEVSSVQNTATSNANSKSLNLSTSGFTPTGAGGSLSKSSSSSAQTLLTSLSAEEVNINVEEATTLKGATIASTDQDGNDNNNLNLTTNTLNISSLNNTSKSKSISVGANIGGSFENNTLNNVSIDFSNNTTNSKTKTLATIGSGNIQITDQTSSETTMLNSDIANNEVDIYNISSHKGLQGELDTRLLTQEGRKQIAEDIERTIRTGEAIGDVATKESIEITDTFDHIGDVQKDLDVQKALSLADNGKIIDILDDKNREKYTQQERDNALNEYAQIYAGIYNIDIQSAKSAIIADKYGSTYTNQENTSSNIFIDNAKNSGALDTANTMGHEVAHARMNQGQTRERIGDLAEEYANTFGEYSADGMEFSSSTYNNVNLNSNSPTTIPTPKTTADITTLTNNTNEYLGDSAKADAGVGRMDDSPLLFIPLAIVALENYGNTPQSKEDIQTGPTDNINLLVGAGTVLKAGQIYQGSKTVVTTALKYDPSLTLTGAGVATGTSAYTNYDKYDGTEYATHVATDGAISFLVGKYIPAGNSMGTSIGYGTLGGSASGFLSELGHQATDTYVFDNQANMNYQNIFLNSAIEGAAGATGKFYNSMGDMMNGGHIINDAVDMGVSQSFKPVIESQRNSFDNQTKQEAE